MKLRLNTLATHLKAIDARFERTWLHRFLDGVPKLIFYSLLLGAAVAGLLSSAYRLTGFPPFYWLMIWPRPLLDLFLPGGFRLPLGGELILNDDASIIISGMTYCAGLFLLLLRESRNLVAAKHFDGPDRGSCL